MQIVSFDEVTSTNDIAHELAKQSAEDICVVANAQTQGRGRLGRSWVTLPSHSLACSILIKNLGDRGEFLPLVTSIAVHQTLFKYAQCSIKWPNDILIFKDKVCGILVERGGSDEDIYYVVGIGVNLTLPTEGLPEGFVGTILENHCKADSKIVRDDILVELLKNLENNLKLLEQEGWVGQLSNYYDDHCGSFCKEVTWFDGKEEITGIARGVNNKGALVLQPEGGKLIEVHSGEIIKQGER